MYDSQSTGKGAITAYRSALSESLAGGYDIHGILGPARSDAAKAMSLLGGIDDIPSISYWATSDQFDTLHSNYPLFSRTIPADSAVAEAAAQFFHSLGHSNVGIAYLDDAYGEAYKSAFVRFCAELEINVQAESFQYQSVDGDTSHIEKAVNNLDNAGILVGIVILSDSEFVPFFEYARTKWMTGDGSLWILSEAMLAEQVRALSGDMVDVVDGMGTLLSQGGLPGASAYDAWLENWKTLDKSNGY